ncbi:MAG: hypothetical protein L0Z47_03310 [Actinobacteria bacterium]|nr:hypothetical protein [Actinomycetota bacterium]MCI0679479.1 hypothetical protein [Actinomycetota bacterium]
MFGLALLLMSGSVAGATVPLPEPHSSCDSEPTRRSTEGTVVADLTVINNTDATFQLYWLDYDGARVYYQDSPPRSTVPQPTWLTHPWILTDADGTCYLLIVMNAVQQTMAIGTNTGEGPVTPVPSTEAGVTTTEAGPSTTNPESSIPPVAADEEAGPGFPTPLVIGALVMMGVLVGVLYATGKLFGGKGKTGS